jgi:hypothetical protein
MARDHRLQGRDGQSERALAKDLGVLIGRAIGSNQERKRL